MNLTKTEKELKCIDHNESALFIDFSQKITKLQRRCLKCLGNEMSSWVDVQEAANNFENVKQIVWGKRQALHQNNFDILRQLQDQLKQLKSTFNERLDKTLLNIDQQLSFIQNGIEKEFRQINELTISQLDQQEQKNNYLLQNLDYKEVQSFYRKQFKRLQMDQYFNQFEESLKQIQQIQRQSIEEVIEVFSSQICTSGKILNQTWQCEDHKHQAALVDLNEKATVPNRLACIDCIPQYPIQYTKIDKIQSMWFEYMKQQQKFQELQQIDLRSKVLSATSKLSSYREIVDELIAQQSQIIESSISSIAQMKSNSINWYALTQSEIIEISNILSQKKKQEILNSEIQNEFQNHQEELKKTIKYSLQTFQDSLFSSFKQILEQLLSDLDRLDQVSQQNNLRSQSALSQESQNDQNTINKSLKYDIVNSFNDDRIEAFAFKDDNSLLAVGYFDSNKIIVYQFDQGQITKISELTDHQECIFCLKFFKNSIQFVSGSYDKSLIIWSRDNQNQWYSKFRLNGHTESVYCLLIDNCENQVISGSADKSIKIWDKEMEWQCIQTLSFYSNSVTSLSINKSNNYLISCAREENQIYVSQILENKKEWILFQIIQIDKWGMKVCFINDLTFAFQPFNCENMYIFEFENSNKNQFVKKTDVKVETGNNCYYLFPLQYIEQKQILVNRNGSKVNFIRKQLNESFTTEFVIDYKADRIFGTVSEDGQYLITWDNKSKQIQIRKYID